MDFSGFVSYHSPLYIGLFHIGPLSWSRSLHFLSFFHLTISIVLEKCLLSSPACSQWLASSDGPDALTLPHLHHLLTCSYFLFNLITLCDLFNKLMRPNGLSFHWQCLDELPSLAETSVLYWLHWPKGEQGSFFQKWWWIWLISLLPFCTSQPMVFVTSVIYL